MMTGLYLKEQRAHSLSTLYLSPHRCGRKKAEWNLSKYCLLNLPFHFSAGCCCCCWFTSAVQIGLSSGQSLLTALPLSCSVINLCTVSQKQTTKARLPLLLPTWFLSGLSCKGLQDDISSCHLVCMCMNTQLLQDRHISHEFGFLLLILRQVQVRSGIRLLIAVSMILRDCM